MLELRGGPDLLRGIEPAELSRYTIAAYPVLPISNSGECPGDDMDLTRTLREFTSYIEGLEPSDLMPTGRPTLRALLDELKAALMEMA